MCSGAEILLGIPKPKSIGHAFTSLFPKPPSAPDPAIERAKAEADATARANASTRMARQAMRGNSLLTGAGSLGGGQPDAGRTTLGV